MNVRPGLLMTMFERLDESGAFDVEGNLLFQRGLNRPGQFETQYLALRNQEGRIYSDAELALLPDVPERHPYRNEWLVRGDSINRLINYLSKGPAPRCILEVGCGNGWLSHQLAKRLSVDVCALDVNESELRQGSRVFAATPNLAFIYADILNWPASEIEFNAIVLASSIQYFPNFKETVARLLDRLTDGGELHILDSPFYSERDISNAQQRSRSYFASIGLPGMIDAYHHHRMADLRPFDAELMYDPFGMVPVVKRKFFGMATSPFPWIRIRNTRTT